jgi:hypothetical protein
VPAMLRFALLSTGLGLLVFEPVPHPVYLQASAACGCAAGSVAVQTAGAQLGAEALQQLRASIAGILAADVETGGAAAAAGGAAAEAQPPAATATAGKQEPLVVH